jgi:hypothetical protein
MFAENRVCPGWTKEERNAADFNRCFIKIFV